MAGGEYFGEQYGGAGASGVPPSANALEHLKDNFNDNSFDTSIWTNWGGANVVEQNARLEIQGTTAPNYFGFQTTATNWSLTSSYLQIQVIDAGDGLTDYEVYPFQLTNNATGNALLIYISAGTIFAVKRVGGVNTYLTSAIYNSATTKWFRIRNVLGTIYFDYSADASTWVPFASTDTSNLDMENFKVDIFAGNWETLAVAQHAFFDNVNGHNLNFQAIGTFKLSGGVLAEVHHTASFSGSFKLQGSVDGAILPELKATSTKVYEYKIYDESFNFLGRWDDVVSDFGFSQAINSAGSSIDITLARNSDTIVRAFQVLTDDSGNHIQTDDSDDIAMELTSTNPIGPGTTVDLNLNVKIIVFPENGPNIAGQVIFTGYISKYVSNYGQNENTIVSIMSYGADMDNYVLESAGATRVPFLSKDPSVILKSALDTFHGDGGIPYYNQGETSIDLTSTLVSYTFNLNTILEIVKKSLELAPTDWYWYYDQALNNVHLHARPVSVSHTFLLGKHILGLNISKYIEDLVNMVYFTGGPLNPFIDDPMTGILDTVLTAHVGTEGAVWSRHPSSAGSGDLKIDSANRLYIASANDLVFNASGESLSNDYTVQADFTEVSATASEWDLLIRMDPTAKTFYLARWITNSTTFHIYKCIAGAFTDLGTFTYTPTIGVPFTMSLSAIGSTITASINGNQMLSVTDASIPTGVISGVRTNAVADTSTTGGHMDNFKATSQENSQTNLFKKYTDATSISTYRRGLDRPSDNRVHVQSSMDILAESELNRSKNPRFQSSVIISDKVYDIESIKLGELVGFRNFGNFIDGLKMQVVRIDYTPDKVTLQLDTLLPSVTKRLEDVKRNLNQSDAANNPDTPI